METGIFLIVWAVCSIVFFFTNEDLIKRKIAIEKPLIVAGGGFMYALFALFVLAVIGFFISLPLSLFIHG